MELNSLPLEVHLKIFSFLPVRDVMKIRRVCKLWNGLIDSEFKFRRLQCYQLFRSNKSNDYSDFNFESTRSFLNYVSNDLKFSRVNYLNAVLVPKACELKNAFDFLNSFKFLKEAKFECYLFGFFRNNAAAEVQKQFVVSLNRLEKADFDFDFAIRESNVSVVLDLPRLLCLSIGLSLTAITIRHPEKLRTLATSSLFDGGLDYSQFTSLTDIYTTGSDVRSISASFLEKLPGLRELHLSDSCLPANNPLPEPSFGKAKPKIFFFGFEFSAREFHLNGEQWPNSFNEFDSTEDSVRFIARNLHRSIDNNQFIDSIDYNLIAGELDDTEMFSVMPQKIPEIYLLCISGAVADENRLLKFIVKFKAKHLSFKRTSLSQRFFEKLAESGTFILNLEIGTEPTMNILAGDFDFIFKLKNLSSLRLEDCPLSLNFVTRALKELKSICSLSIQTENFSFFRITWSCSENLKSVHRYRLYLPGSKQLFYEIPTEETPELLNALKNRLNADGSVCPKELLILLGHLKFEKQNALLMMRKCIYDQRHSICLSEEQMRLLNLRH